MKKTSILFIIAGLFGYVVLTSSSGGLANTNGLLTNGTPGTSSSNCNFCHTGTAGTTTISGIQLTDDATGLPVSNAKYLPGHTYTAVLNASNTNSLPHYGFQVSVSDAANVSAGTFTATQSGTATSTAEGHLVIEQSSRITAPTPGIYGPAFKWKAPSAGKGTVTIRAIVNAVNGDGGNGGDKPSNPFQLALSEGSVTAVGAVSSTMDFRVYPNPASAILKIEMSASASGELNVYSMNGASVFHKSIRGINEVEIPVAHLPAGIYYIRLSGDNGNVGRSFLKQ